MTILTEREALVLSQVARFINLPAEKRLAMVEELTGSAKKIGQAILGVAVSLTEEENRLANDILKWQSPEVRKGRVIK